MKTLPPPPPPTPPPHPRSLRRASRAMNWSAGCSPLVVITTFLQALQRLRVYDCHFCGSVQCPVQYTRYLRATYALPLCNTCTINPILFSSTAGGKTPFLAILMCYMLGTQLRERILFTGSEIDTESSLDICGVQLPPKQVALKGMACPSTYTKNTYNRVHIVLFDSLSSSHTFITRVHVHALFCC